MTTASNPPAHIEYVRLPADMPPQGKTETFNNRGEPEKHGNIIISSFGVQFIWAKFSEPIKAGQIATMEFENLPGAVVMDGAATEWNPATNEPTFGDGIVMLLAVQRGFGTGRIVCRNLYDADLHIAAGVAAPIAAPPPPS